MDDVAPVVSLVKLDLAAEGGEEPGSVESSSSLAGMEREMEEWA